MKSISYISKCLVTLYDVKLYLCQQLTNEETEAQDKEVNPPRTQIKYTGKYRLQLRGVWRAGVTQDTSRSRAGGIAKSSMLEEGQAIRSPQGQLPSASRGGWPLGKAVGCL